MQPQEHRFLVRNQPWAQAEQGASQGEATFVDVIHALLKLACWEAGADSYGLYEFDQARSELTLTCGYGAPSPASRSGHHFAALLSFPLRGAFGLAGILDFGFRTAQPREEARLDILRLCGASIQGILEFVQRTEACQQLTASTVEMETQIAESKIADRARDLLEQGPANGDATRALVAHVERVLAGVGVRSLDDRRLVAKAKDLLQQKFGWTEGQAYLHLRNASRRSRKRMFEVASDLMERGAGHIERLSA